MATALHKRQNSRYLIASTHQSKQTLEPIAGYASEPLLALEEACEPLLMIVSHLSWYVSRAKEDSKHPANDLTQDESAAICLYTMEWDQDDDIQYESLYSCLNQTLRKADKSELRPWYRYLKLFLTALAKLPPVPVLIVWRGTHRDQSNEYPKGAEFAWWSFSSCTTSLDVLESDLYLGKVGKRTLFSIQIFNGRSVRDHSYYPTEDEILLLPGTYFEVMSQLNPAEDLCIVQLKQKQPPHELLEPPFEGAQFLSPLNEFRSNMDMQLESFKYETSLINGQIHMEHLEYSESHNIKNRPWYVEKRMYIGLCTAAAAAAALIIVAIILAAVLASRSKRSESSLTTLPGSMCTFTFATMVSYPTGSHPPDSVAIGDFNNDTRLDIAVANYRGSNVGVFLGYGDGTFAAQALFATGFNPWAVTVADFNDDTRLDIAVANGVDNNVGVLLGNGNGTFAAQMTFLTSTNPWSIAVGDFNNDTRLDIVVANHDSNNVGVLLGYGNGTFTAQTTFPTGTFPYSVAVGDFNNDTRLDIVVANFADNNVSVLLGYGNGTFAAQTTFSSGINPNWIVVGDFNKDSRMDIAISCGQDDNVNVLLGHGDGTFTAKTTFSTGKNPQAVAIGDLNNDNRLDIVVANYGIATVSILLGYGNGTFAAQTTFPTGNNPNTVVIGDFNNDNRLDIAVANYGGKTVGVLLNSCYCCAT